MVGRAGLEPATSRPPAARSAFTRLAARAGFEPAVTRLTAGRLTGLGHRAVVVPTPGLEPGTSCVSSRRSALELGGRRWCPGTVSNGRPPGCEPGALPTELPGHGAEGPNRTAGAPRLQCGALPTELPRRNPSEGWVGFDPTWARFADGILTSLGHQPSDGANDGARTRGLRHGKPALYLLSYVRMVPGRGLEPRFSASKAALLPLETSPERSWLGEKGSNLRFPRSERGALPAWPSPSELWRLRRGSNPPPPARQAGVHGQRTPQARRLRTSLFG